ncbi:MAG: hypothetical protein U0694_03745 [Anaerolineae bacterium]
MSDDKFLYELREDMPADFGHKLYRKLQQQEQRNQQRSLWTLAAAMLVAIIGMSLLLARSSASIMPDTAQASFNNLQPITSANAGQLELLGTLGYGTAEGVAWSPDGTTIAVAGSRGLFLHDASDLNAEPRQINDAWTQYPVYSPDGSALSAISGSAIVMFNPSTGVVLRRIELTDLRYYSLIYSADGTQLAVVACSSDNELVQRDLLPCTNKTVQLWDAVSGELLNSFDIGISTSIALNDDFTLIAWVDDAPRVRIRSTVTDESRILINGPLAAGSNAVAFYEDKLYALTPFDERFTVWETEGILDGTDVIQLSATTIPNYTGASRLLFLAQDEVLVEVAAVNDERLELRDTEGNTLQQFSFQSLPVSDFTLNADQSRLLTLFSDGSLAEWDVTSGEMLALQQRYASQYAQLSFSADHNYLAAGGGYSSAISIWEIASETERRLHLDAAQSLTTVAFALSPDGSQLIYTNYPTPPTVGDTGVTTWARDLASGEVTQIFDTAYEAGIGAALHYASDGTIVSYVNQTISRRAPDGMMTTAELAQQESVTFGVEYAPAISPDGAKLATSYCAQRGMDNTCSNSEIHVWDAVTGELLYALSGGLEDGTNVGLTFSADGNIVAASQCDPQTAARGNSVYYLCAGSTFVLWDISGAPSTDPLEPFATIANADQNQIIYSLLFSPIDEGETLLLFTWSSYDGVQMWNINRVTGEYALLGSLPLSSPRWFTLPAISADGELLAVAGPGITELWGIPES